MSKRVDYLRQKRIYLSGILVVLFVGAFIVAVNHLGQISNNTPGTTTHAAGTGTLSLSPASGSYTVNGMFTLTVDETSASTDAINAVESDLTYNSSELQFISASCSSTFSIAGQATGGSGTVTMACAIPDTTVTGTQAVGTVSFKVIGGGSSIISFASTSSIIRAADQVNVWNGVTTGGTFTLATPPTTSITSPIGGALVHGTNVSISANSSDVIGVTKTEFYVDGTLVATDTASPYSITFNTMPYKDGSHTLTTIAFDAAGLSTTSSAVLVTFNNGDVNGDGHVNLSDLAIMASNWGKTGMTYAQGDLNGDGVVNISDLSILANYYGQI